MDPDYDLVLQIELLKVVKELDETINRVKQEFDDPYRAKYRDGKYVLLDALTAKAHALSALAHLNRTAKE